MTLSSLENKINLGKSTSIIKGLNLAKGKYVILFDGDLEISTIQLIKLFQIHKKNKNYIIKGNRRFKIKQPLVFGLGGYSLLNYLFNFIYQSSFKDIFCCLIIIEKNCYYLLLYKVKNLVLKLKL